jgi:molybdenum cofactor cytidylyltransferase
VITAIVLAAGTASRFGRTKQLVVVDGKPLVQHAVDASSCAGLAEVVVVLGHDADRVRAALSLPANARTVLNGAYRRGLSTSLIAGLDAADPTSEAAVILPADQPGVTASHVRALVRGFEASRRRIVRLQYRDGPGPSLLSREVWPEARALAGDTGAREIAATHPEWVSEVPIDEDVPTDLDEPGDLDRLH